MFFLEYEQQTICGLFQKETQSFETFEGIENFIKHLIFLNKSLGLKYNIIKKWRI